MVEFDINITIVGGLVGLLVVGTSIQSKWRRQPTAPLPPSPLESQWFWGHIIPQKSGFLKIQEWINEYGPVITLRQGRQRIIVVGRYQAAVDIMEKQGASTMDRPRMVAAGDLLSGGLRLIFTSGGERFRRMRRTIHTHLQPKAAESYEPIQMNNAKNTILDLLDDPVNYPVHARRYSSSVVQKIAYGKSTPTSADDPEVQQVHAILQRLAKTMQPGYYLVDTFPFLKYLPWYGRELRKWRQEDIELYTSQLNNAKKQIESDRDAGPSFTKYLLENKSEYDLTELEMAYLTGGFFTAGADTSALTICLMILSAAAHPEAQAKVQAELDSVVGRQRAPNFSDGDALPQLQAFILESLRWRPSVAPSGVAHKVNKDVIWGNYLLPAGTTIIGNTWSIAHDPEVYPDPESFKHERWLDSQGKIRDDIKFPIFGFGRRVCPGQHVATRSVFINTLLILWSFRLSRDPSESFDDMAFMGGFIPPVPPKVYFEKRLDEKELRRLMERYTDQQ